MSVKVLIPTPLRRLTEYKQEVMYDGATVNEVVRKLENEFAPLRNKLFDQGGKIKKFIKVYVNGKDINELAGGETPVADGDEVTLVPAAFGG
jgi:sulfur-carrier protein